MWRNVCARHSRRSSAIGSRFRQYSSRKHSRVANVARSEVTAPCACGPHDSVAARWIRSLSFNYLDKFGLLIWALPSLRASRVLVDSRAIDFMHDAPSRRMVLHCGESVAA